MVGQLQENDQVLHFTCEHCQISLSVDESLAGVTGPCPSCGGVVTAPSLGAVFIPEEASTPEEAPISENYSAPEEAPIRDNSSTPEAAPQSIVIKPRGVPRRIAADARKEAGEFTSVKNASGTVSRRERRAVSPNTGLSEAHKEKVEVATIVKMLIAGLLVVGVVLVVAYLLNSQFQPAV